MAWDALNSDGNLRDDWNDPAAWSRDANDDQTVAKIFDINVTNSISGGASSCVQCQEGFIYSTNLGDTDEKGSCPTCSPGFIRTIVCVGSFSHIDILLYTLKGDGLLCILGRRLKIIPRKTWSSVLLVQKLP